MCPECYGTEGEAQCGHADNPPEEWQTIYCSRFVRRASLRPPPETVYVVRDVVTPTPTQWEAIRNATTEKCRNIWGTGRDHQSLRALLARRDAQQPEKPEPTNAEKLVDEFAQGIDWDTVAAVADSLGFPVFAKRLRECIGTERAGWNEIQRNALRRAAKLLKDINLPVYVSAVEAILARGTPEEAPE